MDDLISTSEASVALGVSPLTVRRWIDQGALSAQRIGRMRVLIRSEVQRLAEVRAESPGEHLSPGATKVLDALARLPDGVTCYALGACTGQNPATVRHYLSGLRKRGLVVRLGRQSRVASANAGLAWLWAATPHGIELFERSAAGSSLPGEP
jgi:excisionase family DNA binding protein